MEAEYFNLEDECIQKIRIFNLFNVEVIRENKDVIEDRKRQEYEQEISKEEFIEKLDILYPSLVFGKVAREQLKSKIEDQHFRIIRKKLFELQEIFSNWNGERISNDMFQSKMTTESKETLKAFKDEHTFEFENKIVVASHHIRYTGNIAGRIYFYPEKNDKKAYICSLTTKLPTVSEPKMKI